MNPDNTIASLAELKSCKGKIIKRIKIADNLTEFPQAIFDYKETLEVLDLSGNQLCELPSNFSQLAQLKILFLSNNHFVLFPSVLFACARLTMIGFKENYITHIPEKSLPINTRWLILTDNQLTTLPHDIGNLHVLEKCILAGNALQQLPNSFKNCRALKLLRISANQLQYLPEAITQLPQLAWLAVAGNSFTSSVAAVKDVPTIAMNKVRLGDVLGEGASGVIYHATVEKSQYAIKLFKGEVTSDGYPADELHACLSISAHPNLVRVIARVDELGSQGVLMDLIPNRFENLGQPPSLSSCTRDTFNDCHRFTQLQVISIIRQVADVLAHIHQHHFIHGDIYAHNISVDSQGSILLGDMGAASNIVHLSHDEKNQLLLMEYRAFAYLIDDILVSCVNFDVNFLPQDHELLRIHALCQKMIADSYQQINLIQSIKRIL